jgi:hypothetical protein
MKKIFNIKLRTGLPLMLALILLTSCEDSLDISQHGVSSFETFYQTDAEAEEAITAAYANLAGIYFNYYTIKNMCSDDFWCGGGGPSDNPDIEKLNSFTYNQNNEYIQNAFQSYYGIIYLSNVVLGHVPDETPIQKRARAEAKVFREFAYIDLISMWGTPPLVDHELTPSEYRQGNGDPETLWEFVETNLTEAINSGTLYEKTNKDDQSNYRITKQYAQALLGKAHVFQEEWEAAATVLDQVIESNKYDLYPDFENVLQYTTDNNCESLFEFNYVNDIATPGTNLTIYSQMAGWRTDKMTIGMPLSDLLHTGQWGYYSAFQKDLYEAFVAREGVNGYRLNATMKTYEQVQQMGGSVKPGSEIYGYEGYFMWKNRTDPGEVTGVLFGFLLCTQKNIRIMRYAEVLLLAAEAHLKGGDASKAKTYVNKIRTRAQLAELPSVTMNDVMIEKRLELCAESVRLQDMLRWGIAEDKMKGQGVTQPWLQSSGTVRYEEYHIPSKSGFKSQHNLMPFPQVELTLNPNITQNEGW